MESPRSVTGRRGGSFAPECALEPTESFALSKLYRVASVQLVLAALILCLPPRLAYALPQPSSPPFSGIVEDALRRPVPDVIVTLLASDGRMIAEAVTNEHGQFRLRQGLAGTYALKTRKQGFKPTTTIITLPSPVSKPLELVLESEIALNVPVKASRVRAQNGLSHTGNSKYTMTA
jgi:hypothetical protein